MVQEGLSRIFEMEVYSGQNDDHESLDLSLCYKGELRLQVVFRLLKQRRSPALSRWAQCNHRVLKRASLIYTLPDVK